ncbi:hypothetical protein AMATHDRAFT_138432 [Amanita thiersii Skay4041]|uniref:Metal homeostatis protein bsd2 n=1 Tax=Amanita thiersii Skay4041 TaxID=703135 RepID=A0A2A9NYL5_9AGAR|nr:hypothetical protein AMATHDRAFT_138432 [Amanita thiersii Skay4041]
MSHRYAPLHNPASTTDNDRELEDAFASENEDEPTTITTTTTTTTPHRSQATNHIPGAYDFEREYDYPPPGSPPRPSSRALPNDYGNTNGLLPTSPARPAPPRPSIIRRAIGVLLPQHYTRVATSESQARVVGGGTENDGVFANVMAKPQVARVVREEDGSIHIVPEDNQKEAPPSYTEAQADAVPPYWETTVHAPLSAIGSDILVDDLPAGSAFVFVINTFISFFFQFVGFFLTYLLHTSHAAKFGSRAGLGLTLIQYGFYSRSAVEDNPTAAEMDQNVFISPDGTNTTDATTPAPIPDDSYGVGITPRDWLSFLFMTLGWFLLISSVIGFWRVKRWESSVRTNHSQAPASPEEIERDLAVRRNLESVFGVPAGASVEEDDRTSHVRYDEFGNVLVLPNREALAEARLARDLRAAGLI